MTVRITVRTSWNVHMFPTYHINCVQHVEPISYINFIYYIFTWNIFLSTLSLKKLYLMWTVSCSEGTVKVSEEEGSSFLFINERSHVITDWSHMITINNVEKHMLLIADTAPTLWSWLATAPTSNYTLRIGTLLSEMIAYRSSKLYGR
jgi:hypothetical protein